MSSDTIVHSAKQVRYSSSTQNSSTKENAGQDASSGRMRPLQGKLPMDHLLVFQQDGDVLIKIENYSLRVSRQKLSSISAVFSATLNGRFREGKKTTLGDQLVHQVSLPEDDIDLVLLLCKILYNRQDLIEEVPHGRCLLELTVLCDKYQCVQSLKTELTQCIVHSLYFYSKYDTKNLCSLLLASYIIDCNEEFQTISEMILNIFRKNAWQEQERGSFYQLLNHPLIKADFANALESNYNDMNQKIDRLLSRPFQRLRNCCCGGHPNTRAKRAGSFMEQLFKAELMPTDIQKESIAEISKRVESLGQVSFCHFSYCRTSANSLREMLMQEMKNINDRGTGLCLDCLKLNNRTGQAGRCRKPHTDA
uniref:BTB domain-containing protein n=1 Tax=Talaromyces marneffei PM1 TaxID=1077442 RepID=A0A093XN32_TALMA